MPADISGYDYKIMADGYQQSADQESGYRITVPYLLPWADAWNFADEIMGRNSATTVGPWTYKAPYRFPVATADLYARHADVIPMGFKKGTLINKGLSPGEFFDQAIVRVEFGPLGASLQPTEGQLQQLDPDNPITLCRQSVRQSGKMETLKKGHYVYDSDSVKVDGDYAVPTCESVLELEFPLVPYLPWQLTRPYIGTINATEILGCDAGELLFEGMSTRVEATTLGLSQSIVYNFAATKPGVTWNHLPRPDGTLALVKKASGSGRIYDSTEFWDLIDVLNRAEA